MGTSPLTDAQLQLGALYSTNGFNARAAIVLLAFMAKYDVCFSSFRPPGLTLVLARPRKKNCSQSPAKYRPISVLAYF